MPNNHAAQPEEDLVRLYLNDIGKHSLLTKDDEARLAQAIEAGRGRQPRASPWDGSTGARTRALSRASLRGSDGLRTQLL